MTMKVLTMLAFIGFVASLFWVFKIIKSVFLFWRWVFINWIAQIAAKVIYKCLMYSEKNGSEAYKSKLENFARGYESLEEKL